MNSVQKEAYDTFTRTGFSIKGVIYILLGVLAVVAAASPAGKTTGRLGVLIWLDHQPLGSILLILIGLGLVGYVVLRFVQAFKDTNHKGSGWKGLSRRAGYFISGFSYLLFFFACIYFVFPNARKMGKEEAGYIASLLELPAGNIVVAIIGAFSFGYGVFEIVRGFKTSFKHHLNFKNINKRHKKVLSAIGVIGYVARGIILSLIGYLIIKAAFNAYVDNLSITSQAFSILSSLLGKLYMGIIALGLVFYGLFNFVKAKLYQITPL